MDTYDAGFLNDYGGGDVGWWQDYLRAELGRAEEFYRNQHDRLMAEKDAEIARLKLALGEILSYDRNFYDSGRPGYEAIARAALKEIPDA